MKTYALIVFIVIVVTGGALGWYQYQQQTKLVVTLSDELAAFKRLPELTNGYAPALFVGAVGNDVTFKLPTQVTRDGQVYVEYQDRHARMTESSEIITPDRSLPRPPTVSEIAPGTEVRIGLETNPTDPNDITISVIYLLK